MADTAPAPAATVLDVQGLALRLWDHAAGEANAPRALFVHGYLDTGRSFDEVGRLLAARGVRALCLDLRGHGESAWVGAGGGYHLLDHLKDVALVLQRLAERGLGVDVLVGHSMGGNIAALVAGAKPTLVERLVLVDSCGPPAEDAEQQPARLEELVDSVLVPKRAFSTAASIDDAARKIRAQNAGLSEQGARRMVEHAMQPVDGGGLRYPFDPRLRGPSPIRWPEAMWLEMFARMTMPVLVVRAEDGYVPEGEPLPSRLARARAARVVTVPGTHHIHVEQPALLAEHVAAHLSSRH